MALSLTIEDEQDGTGATATIAGSDAATVTVYTSPLDSGTRPLTWTSAGTRSGNGTLTLSVAPGYYFAYASGTVSGSPALSPPVYFVASRDEDAVLERAAAAVQAKVRMADLSGLTTPPGTLPAERVYRYPMLNEMAAANMTLPAVVVTEPGSESEGQGTSARDDVGYPINVTIVDRAAPHQKAPDPFGTFKRWRERIRRILINQHLAVTVTEVFVVKWEPQAINDWVGDRYEYYTSSQTFRCIAREPRTV